MVCFNRRSECQYIRVLRDTCQYEMQGNASGSVIRGRDLVYLDSPRENDGVSSGFYDGPQSCVCVEYICIMLQKEETV